MNSECPVCGGQLVLMGMLGWMRWSRCQSCGIQVSSREDIDEYQDAIMDGYEKSGEEDEDDPHE